MRGSHCFADLLAERLAPPRIHFLLCGITVDALAILASEASVHECSTVSERGNERLARLVGIDHDIHAIKTRKGMLSETDVVLVDGIEGPKVYSNPELTMLPPFPPHHA